MSEAHGTRTSEVRADGGEWRRTARRVVLLALGAFALGLDAYVVAGLLPSVAADLDVPQATAGQMVTVFTLCYALAAPVFATLLSGRPARAVLGLALAVFTVANGLSALAFDLPVLLLARALAGIGAGVYSPIAAATAAAMAGPERRGRSLAIVMGGMSIGTVVGVPVGVQLAEYVGWRGTLWLVTALGLLALVGVVALLPRTEATPPPPLRERVRVLGDGRVAPIALVSFLGGVASLGLYTYLATFLSDAADVANPVGHLWVWGVGGVLGSLLVGPLVDRTKRAYPVVAGLLAVLIAAHTALPTLAPHVWAVMVPLVLWGAVGWALQVPQQHRLIEARPDHAPVAISLNSSAVYLGSAAGSALGGAVLAAGLPAARLPYCTAGVAVLALLLHLTAAHWTGRGPARRASGTSRRR
ncbi:putative MFS family arabinose efflux permease [Nocardiopsis mwathae]|uniref:Putative MFS family arabinose efflux permease n=1 Tax=Nocardiopsis mwathae TaxID=1472723 RepID=A0A7X0D8M8_9ACTN|nr:MFS transporter [Nocardiopsis mwathae]MBB6174184.1 putative MFS family arabinose efflux permease [Nocardiopsis mwathae]